ncbi:MAG: hypothetical protein JKY96_02735 [Phycisphaerales bacterium]|nr:hypothetical protein [Phycisphaerales bacterium]
MTGAINNLAASLSGAPLSASNAQRKKIREDSTKAQNRRGISDAYVKTVAQTQAIDTVRTLADADQEDACEDRQEHQIEYTPQGHGNKPSPKRLDINA